MTIRKEYLRQRILVPVYAGAVACAAISLAVVLLTRGWSLNASLWVLVALAALAAVSERQPVRISSTLEITVAVLPILFAAVMFGPLAGMLVAALGLLGDLRRPYIRWLIWTSIRALAGGLAGIAAVSVQGASSALTMLLAAVVAAALTEAIVDIGLNGLTVAIRGRSSIGVYARSVWPILAATVPLYAPVLVMLAYAYEVLSVWSVLLFLAPGLAAHSLYRLYREQRRATEDLTEANLRLQRANLSFAGALVTALDARDQYTAGHSAAVAVYARGIARELGLPSDQQELAHLCGLLHDIGKVGVPPAVLEKVGPLTPDERVAMEEHSTIGERILANVEDYSEIAVVVRHHHERVDGTGYPDGVPGDRIPLIARIIAVADAFDAMTSDRPYRRGLSAEIARARLAEAAGSQLDPMAVSALERVLSTSSLTPVSRRVSFADEAQNHACLSPAVLRTAAA
jgi:putative nucleotidyltransferase with HDIG domain